MLQVVSYVYLEQEVDMIELMRDKVMANDICRDLYHGNKRYMNKSEEV